MKSIKSYNLFLYKKLQIKYYIYVCIVRDASAIYKINLWIYQIEFRLTNAETTFNENEKWILNCMSASNGGRMHSGLYL